MSPKAFRQFMSQNRLSLERAARLFGVSERTIRRWERGDAKVDQTAETLVAMVQMSPASLSQIEQMLSNWFPDRFNDEA